MITHGQSNTAEHRCWVAMRNRCQNASHANFADYGGRGITVCPQWESFETFLRDMGPRPSPKHSLDRIDNSRGYSMANCRWATPIEQSTNRRSTVPVGGFKSQRAASRATGISKSTIGMRIARGIDPLKGGDARRKLTAAEVAAIRATYSHRVGEYGLSPVIAKEYGVAPRTIRHVLAGTRWSSA